MVVGLGSVPRIEISSSLLEMVAAPSDPPNNGQRLDTFLGKMLRISMISYIQRDEVPDRTSDGVLLLAV